MIRSQLFNFVAGLLVLDRRIECGLLLARAFHQVLAERECRIEILRITRSIFAFQPQVEVTDSLRREIPIRARPFRERCQVRDRLPQQLVLFSL